MKDEALKLAKAWFERNTYGDEAVEVYEAIEQALAAPVQEPYKGISEHMTKATKGRVRIDPVTGDVGIGTAPAAQPAVPDAFGTREGEHPQYIQGWNDCRAEMLRTRSNT